MTDFITVLRSRRRRLAKLIHADGRVVGYDQAKTFDMCTVAVADLDHLQHHLERLANRPDLCIVRAAIIGGARLVRARRLLKEDVKLGDVPTLTEAPHYWIGLDVDGVARPDDVPATDLQACAHLAIALLPGEFRDARCIVQASGSHGIKPGCRLRLWFWAERRVNRTELEYWFRRAPVDTSLFQTIQPIYTANPVFAPGLCDHLPSRITELAGSETVETPTAEDLTPPPAKPYSPSRKFASKDQHASRIMVRALARVGAAADGDRHNAIRAAAYTIGGILDAAGVSEAEAKEELLRAAKHAGCATPEKDADTIESGLRAGRLHPIQLEAAT